MRRIAHISDLHFGREDRAMVAILKEDLQTVRADLVLVSGDLTQRARSHEFQAAAAFLRSLPMPALAVPGNHDIPLFDVWRRLTSPFHRYEKSISPDLTPSFLDGELAVLGMNTVLPYVWKGGLVRGHQLEALQAWAKKAEGRLRVVFAHHPFSRPEAAGHSLVRGWSRAIATMEEAEVDLVLTGHHHIAGHSESRAFAVGGPHRLIIVRAGTATSVRMRGHANSYNLIRADAERIVVEERKWEVEGFAAGKVQTYPRRA